MKRLASSVVAGALGIAAGLGLAYCTPSSAAQKAHKVAICHGTASAKNPYVMIIVDESALRGHFDGTAPGHGKNNAPDFVLGRVNTKADEAALRRAGKDSCKTTPSEPPGENPS